MPHGRGHGGIRHHGMNHHHHHYGGGNAKPIKCEKCGNFFFPFLGVIMMVASIIGMTCAWWYLEYFACSDVTDLGYVSDRYYYIVLSKGICEESLATSDSDFTKCIAWKKLISEGTSKESDAAEIYVNTYGLNIATFVISVIYTVVCFVRGQFLIPAEEIQRAMYWRVAQTGLAVVATILFIVQMSYAHDTYFTKQSTYLGNPHSCLDITSAPDAGYVFAVLGFIFGLISSINSAYPVCPCCTRPEDPSKVEPVNEQQQQEAVAQVTMQQLMATNMVAAQLQQQQIQLQSFILQHAGQNQGASNVQPSAPISDFGLGSPNYSATNPGVFVVQPLGNEHLGGAGVHPYQGSPPVSSQPHFSYGQTAPMAAAPNQSGVQHPAGYYSGGSSGQPYQGAPPVSGQPQFNYGQIPVASAVYQPAHQSMPTSGQQAPAASIVDQLYMDMNQRKS